jgi:hypothetical protein
LGKDQVCGIKEAKFFEPQHLPDVVVLSINQ